MIAILPQNGEKRRFRRQKNLLMEASSYFPMQCIELFVAQRIEVLPLQKRFGRAILGLSTFKNYFQEPSQLYFFVGTKLTIFSGIVKFFL